LRAEWGRDSDERNGCIPNSLFRAFEMVEGYNKSSTFAAKRLKASVPDEIWCRFNLHDGEVN
jgi:hypothetical protein